MELTKRFHWERYEPNIGDNLAAPPGERLWFELAVGMSFLDLKEFNRIPGTLRDSAAPVSKPSSETSEDINAHFEKTRAEANDKAADILSAGWAPFVRLGSGSHSVDGKPLTGLRDYLRFIIEQPGVYNIGELSKEMNRLNSVNGTRALFSEPPSGGSTSTPRPLAAPGGSQTGGR